MEEKRLALLLILFVLGCTNNNSGITTTSVNVGAVFSNVSKGNISVYDLNSDGSKGNLLVTGVTDSSGTVNLILPIVNHPVLLELTSGDYIEEGDASKQTIDAANPVRAVLPSVDSTTVTASITPLTEIAYNGFTSGVSAALASNTNLSTLAANQNFSVGQAAGIMDPVGIPPSDIVNSAASINNDYSGQYAIFLAGFSEQAKALGVNSQDLTHLYSDHFKVHKDFNLSASAIIKNKNVSANWADLSTHMQTQMTIRNIYSSNIPMPAVNTKPAKKIPHGFKVPHGKTCPSHTVLTGIATKNTLVGATVTVNLANSDGTPGVILGSGVTGANGNFLIKISAQANPFNKPIIYTAKGGYYLNPKTSNRVQNTGTLTGYQYHCYSQSYSLSTATHIAAARVLQLIKNGLQIKSAILTAHAEVAKSLGLTSITVPPITKTTTVVKMLNPILDINKLIKFSILRSLMQVNFVQAAVSDSEVPTPESESNAMVLVALEDEMSTQSTQDDLFPVLDSLAADFSTDAVFNNTSISFSNIQTDLQSIKDSDQSGEYSDAVVPIVNADASGVAPVSEE